MAIVTATFPFAPETVEEFDFGPLYGAAAIYFRSRTSTHALTGIFRLANAEAIAWRNAANLADLSLLVNSSNRLTFNSIVLADLSSTQTLTNKTLTLPVISSISNTGVLTLPTSTDTLLGRATTDTLTNKSIDATSNTISNISNAEVKAGAGIAYSKLSLTGSIVNADIGASAAIALSKLAALSTAKALQSNASTGLIEASSVTNTELGFVSGVTSAIQTQFSGKVDTTGDQTISGIKTFSTSVKLASSGGTPSALNFYEEGTFTANFNGGVNASGSPANTSKTVKFTRMGNVVTLDFSDNMSNITTGTTVSSNMTTTGGDVPSRLRPGTSSRSIITRVTVSGAQQDQPGMVSVATSGDISINRVPSSGTNWPTGTANNGMIQMSMTYSIA